MRLDCASRPARIVGRNKITSAPRASVIVLACKSVTTVRSGTSTGSLSGLSIFLVGHVSAAASKTRKVDASDTTSESEGTVREASGSAQIKKEVSVRQQSRIL